MSKPKLQVVDNCGEFYLDEELMPLVPPGVYTAAYVKHETRQFFGSSYKAVFWFRIVDMGSSFGVTLARYYNVKKLTGKPSVGGKFIPGRSSDFIREYCRLFPVRIKRLDRIALTKFKEVLIKVRVRTTTRDRRQRSLPGPLTYSVVEELVGVDR